MIRMNYKLLNGDALEKLKLLPDNSIDAVVTDPPSGIAFMSCEWDKDKGGRDEWIKWLSSIFVEVNRVLKPGGHCLVWALPRTSHWTATAIEDAGFEIRDIITHIQAQGFPKSLNIGKGVDKKLGNEREVVGVNKNVPNKHNTGSGNYNWNNTEKDYNNNVLSKGSSPYEGWGTGLKPAHENYILAVKQIDKYYINNIEKIMNNICQYLLNVNVVKLYSMLNPVEQNEVLDFVQMNVEEKYNTLESLLEVMDMSPSKKMISSFLNIVKLWKNILEENLNNGNKSTTSIQSKMITELKILNCYLSENTPKNITKVELKNVGNIQYAEIVEKNTNIEYQQIEEFFVVLNVLLNTIKNTATHTKEIELETNKDNLFNDVETEDWILCRKPISEKTIVDNVLKFGTGGINIDGCRIGTEGASRKENINKDSDRLFNGGISNDCTPIRIENLGRFPANLIHDGSEEVMEEFEKAGVSKSEKKDRKLKDFTIWKTDIEEATTKGFNDTGTPARFFYNTSSNTCSKSRFVYVSKPSTKERNMGCDEVEIIININPLNFYIPKDYNIKKQFILWEKEDLKVLLQMDTEQSITKDIEELTSTENQLWNIDTFMNYITEQFQKECGYITKMETQSTMNLETWNLLIQQYIKEYIQDVNYEKMDGGNLVLNVEKQNTKNIITNQNKDGLCLGVKNVEYNIKKNYITNNHCTVKSVKLMAYLITLITPENGIVLDPFTGSGTTGISSLLLNKKFIGIEQNEEYIKIADTRIKAYEKYRIFLK